MTPPVLLLMALLALLLVSAGIEDVRRREIADGKNIAIALLAPAWWWATDLSPWPGIALQLGVALAVFALFAAAFYAGQMGGGDVKMIGALALWVPPLPLVWMLLVMSLVGGAITILMLAEARVRRTPGTIEVPYGVAVALAALLWLSEPIFNPLA